MEFCEDDFDIFKECDPDACPACMTGKCKGRSVSRPEYEEGYYNEQLKVKLEPKFKALCSLIVDFLRENFDINLEYEFEQKSGKPKKRPLCYINLIQTAAGTGQTNAQFNLRLSYDRRPERPGMTWNEMHRYRKFGIKFALHDKCRPQEKNEMRNRDLSTLIKNVKLDTERFRGLLSELKDDFLIYKNMWEGIQPDCFRANTINIDQLNSLFPGENRDNVPFQEIHRSLYWDNPIHRKIISNQNKLAAECVKTILRLYPFFLYATTADFRILSMKIDSFKKHLEKRIKVLNCSKILHLQTKYTNIKEGKDPELQRHFKEYINDATQLSICDLYLGKSKELPQTILEICKMVNQKNICKVSISMPKYNKLKLKHRDDVSEGEFEDKINNLKNKIVELGFRKRLVELDREHFDDDLADRLIKTDKWTITEQTGHPLDFIGGRKRTTNKSIRLMFVPIAKTKFE